MLIAQNTPFIFSAELFGIEFNLQRKLVSIYVGVDEPILSS